MRSGTRPYYRRWRGARSRLFFGLFLEFVFGWSSALTHNTSPATGLFPQK